MMKKVLTPKKMIAFLVAIISVFTIALTFSSNQNTIVKAEWNGERLGGSITVFSLEDYIDESIFSEFTKKTGTTVNYLTFATNEEMYNELKKDNSACDLLCTSEYMLMKMISEGMIKEFDTPNNLKNYGSEYINSVFQGLEIKNHKGENVRLMSTDKTKTYVAGYMWGTIGLIYNKQSAGGLTDADFETWSVIWERFNNRVTIKDSIRDSYFIALAKVYQDELLQAKQEFNLTGDRQAYSEKLNEIFNRTDKETVDKVEIELKALKENIYAFEVDAGKSDILTGKIDVNFAWSGDAVYALKEGLYDFDDDGNIVGKKSNPTLLGYAVPSEGSNIWFDAYAMTNSANVKRASAFLDFLCEPEIAVANMDYTGYTSCVAGNSQNTLVFDYVLESYASESGTTIDLSYFFDPAHTGDDYNVTVSDELLSMFIAQYPTEDIIARCAVMKNFSGEELERINEMWQKVKLTTLPTWAIWLIISVVIVLLVAVIAYKYREAIAKLVSNIKNKIEDKKSKKEQA